MKRTIKVPPVDMNRLKAESKNFETQVCEEADCGEKG